MRRTPSVHPGVLHKCHLREASRTTPPRVTSLRHCLASFPCLSLPRSPPLNRHDVMPGALGEPARAGVSVPLHHRGGRAPGSLKGLALWGKDGGGRGRQGELLLGDKLFCIIYMIYMCIRYFNSKIKTNVTEEPASSEGSLVRR